MIKIRKIILDEPIPVYDITVPKTESFYANGILVHNCNEVWLSTDKDHSSVCCLSSINLEYWDSYKADFQFFKDIAEMMDNVMQYFIDYAPPSLQRAINSAKRERSIGLGAMGFHSYLQSKMLPFECAMAKSINTRIFKEYRTMLNDANTLLGAERGSPEILEGTGLRFTHLMALAPTASNATITGNCSPSIEPWRANAFRQDTLSGSYTQKNKWLDGYFKKYQLEHLLKDEWYEEQWQEVINAAGSVQQLKWMPDEDKEVFKTAAEIDNLWIIEHASDRQQYIDQGQSVHMFIEPSISVARLHAIHYAAWKKGLKGLYYCRSEKLHNTSVSKKVIREKLEDDIQLLKDIAAGETCIACEG